MSVQETFSRLKKGLKRRIKGGKHNQDGESAGTGGGRTDLGESPSRPESPFAGSGNRNLCGSGSNPVGGYIGSTDRPAQRDGSDPMLTGESKPNQEGRGEGVIDQNKSGQARPSHLHSDVEVVVGSGPDGEVEQVPSDSLIPGSAKPNGM